MIMTKKGKHGSRSRRKGTALIAEVKSQLEAPKRFGVSKHNRVSVMVSSYLQFCNPLED